MVVQIECCKGLGKAKHSHISPWLAIVQVQWCLNTKLWRCVLFLFHCQWWLHRLVLNFINISGFPCAFPALRCLLLSVSTADPVHAMIMQHVGHVQSIIPYTPSWQWKTGMTTSSTHPSASSHCHHQPLVLLHHSEKQLTMLAKAFSYIKMMKTGMKTMTSPHLANASIDHSLAPPILRTMTWRLTMMMTMIKSSWHTPSLSFLPSMFHGDRELLCLFFLSLCPSSFPPPTPMQACCNPSLTHQLLLFSPSPQSLVHLSPHKPSPY